MNLPRGLPEFLVMPPCRLLCTRVPCLMINDSYTYTIRKSRNERNLLIYFTPHLQNHWKTEVLRNRGSRRRQQSPQRSSRQQIYNHNLYWNSLSPDGGGEPTGDLLDAIKYSFGTFEDFKTLVTSAATGHFGSGWAWLVFTEDGTLDVRSSNAYP